MTVRYLNQAAPAACCVSAQAPTRSTAARLLAGHCDVPATLAGVAREIATAQASAPPGRVVSGGRFSIPDVHEQLRAALPPSLRASLREGFEWYACRGAHFHTDAHYGDVLFGAWCACGPARELVFARGGLRLPAVPGAFVVFDPFEPHAVLDPARARYERADYAAAAPNVFIGFELALDQDTATAFGVHALAQQPADMRELSSRIAVNAETGALGEAD